MPDARGAGAGLDLRLDLTARAERVGRALENALREAVRSGRPRSPGSGTRVAGSPSDASPAGARSTAARPPEEGRARLADLRPGRPDLGSFLQSAWPASVRRRHGAYLVSRTPPPRSRRSTSSRSPT